MSAHHKKDHESIRCLVECRVDLDGETRARSAQELAKWYPHWPGTQAAREAIPVLLQALCGEDEDLRRIAAYTLGYIGDDRTIDPLLAQLSDPKIHVRKAVEHALGGISPSPEQIMKAYPRVLCQNCLTRFRPVSADIDGLRSLEYAVCRVCETYRHPIANATTVVGIVGGNGLHGETLWKERDTVYVRLWDGTRRQARHSDIDVLEIRDEAGMTEEECWYALQAVQLALVDGHPDGPKSLRRIPWRRVGSPPLLPGAINFLEATFQESSGTSPKPWTPNEPAEGPVGEGGEPPEEGEDR